MSGPYRKRRTWTPRGWTKNDRAVFGLSVYNAVAMGRATTVEDVVRFLHSVWHPAQSRNAARVNEKNVARAGGWLEDQGLLRFDGSVFSSPANNAGRPLRLGIDYARGAIVTM